MKNSRIILAFILVFGLVLASGCAASGPDATEKPAVEPTETAGQPLAEEDPELVWSHKHENNIHSIASSGETVAVGEFKVTYVHHLFDGSLVDVLVHEHSVDDIEFSKDGALLGAGQGYYGVLLTNVVDGAEPQTIGDGHESRLAFSPDGISIATGNREGIVWIWEIDSLSQTAALENPEVPAKAVMNRRLLAIDYHPSGKSLAATHTDGIVYIWDIEKEEITQTLQYGADVTAGHTFRFSPNSNDMAYAVKDGGDHLIRICTVESGEKIRDLTVPERVMDLNFSPDGTMLAVASRQATTVWDVASGELLYTLDQTITPPEDSPVALTFTPDGGHIAVARWDGTVELWRFPGAEPIPAPPVDMRVPPPLPSDVLFDTGSAKLKEAANAELESFANELYASFTKAKITFIGHTDSRGDANSNLQLSLDRATAIKNWFQTWADEKGIDGWTLLVDGKGETELKAPDTNVEGTFLENAGALNRRVEIEIEPDE